MAEDTEVRRSRLNVGIIRHQLFKYSEPFILDQSSFCSDSAIHFIGREIMGGQPEDSRYSLLAPGFAAGLKYIVMRDGRRLREICRDLQLDVLHAHFGLEGMCAAHVGHDIGTPLITTLHGYDATRTKGGLLFSRSPSLWRYALERRHFLKAARNLVCVSNFIRERAIRLGARESACHVIPTGVDTLEIQPSSVPRSPVVLHVGRLVEVKGTKYLIRAIAEVARKTPEVELRVVGDGPLLQGLLDLVETLGIQKNVTFLGSRPRAVVLEEIASARALCLPSVSSADGSVEGLGQVLLEAGASGRPVIGTRSGGIPEVIEDGVTGRLVPERDTGALADALREVLGSNTFADAAGAAGRNRVVNCYDIREGARCLQDLYRSSR